MNKRIHLRLAIRNGIATLKEELSESAGSVAALAMRYSETARHLGNERAAAYWEEVESASRRLGIG